MTRFVILGDTHVSKPELKFWSQAIDDINRLQPQAVLMLGDLTGGPETGSGEGLQQAVELFKRLDAPWHTIIGNHDLQAEEFVRDEDAVADFLRRVGRNRPWFVETMGPIAVMGLSNTQWRTNPDTPHEIVLDERQLEWWKQALAEHAGDPVLVLCHAPPIGSAVLTVTELHARVGNAFVNQNHRPGLVQRIVHENPNILFWFSGHNHLGQHYRDAISVRQGVHYVHTGVASRIASRDGQRQSRVLDVGEGGFLLRTFDHVTRDFDLSLDFESRHGLREHLAYRRRILGRRQVPMAPGTMRQSLDESNRMLGWERTVRFAFLCDVHMVQGQSAIQQRVIDWCIQQVKGRGVERLVLGGDITHQAQPCQAERFLHQLHLPLPTVYLPGNNEGDAFEIDPKTFPRVRMIRGCQSGATDWPGNVFFLQTTNPEDARASLDALLDRMPRESPVLVLAHFAPDQIYPEAEARLCDFGSTVWWLCGHGHERRVSHGALEVRMCAGLDPVKVRGCLPELLVVDWDGAEARVEIVEMPTRMVDARRCANPVGLACQDRPETLLAAALAHGIDALQFHHSACRDHPGEAVLAAIASFRKRFAGGFLSLHLPGFPADQPAPAVEQQEPWLAWATAAGVDDLTVHLPKVPAGSMFDEHRHICKSEWATRTMAAYVVLAQRCIAMGAGLSIENLYNKHGGCDQDEVLSSRPWHLARFVDELRHALMERGQSQESANRIGIIFDAAHAFRDPVVSKDHGLVDWLRQLAPMIRLMHVHQVRPGAEGEVANHLPISDLRGPRINYRGLLAAIADELPLAVPLLIEVRDSADAIRSYNVLREVVAPPGSPMDSAR